ncbi:MAG: OmpA family protein, partial [Pseudomonadota bacterium]|nr:OmpA family protein [Pseudomonadota bacterium]
MKRWLFLAATSLILAGCTPWPEHGQGGFAEDYPPQLAACAEGDNLRTLETYLDRLRTSKIRLDVLMLEGASVWFPGLVHVSRDQAARTTRVLFACRVKDTEADLAVLNNQLDDLEKRLNAVISYGICCGIPDGSDNLNVPEASIVTDDLPADFVSGARLATDSSAIAEARDLLDITALFDFDKSEVRTEARQQIFKAGEILSRLPDVMITVYGHTDSKGSDEYNQGLSERRAWAVRELLVESGMSPTH